MNNNKKIKLYLLRKIASFVAICFSVFCFASLASHNFYGPEFGLTDTSIVTANWMGLLGAYFSKIIFVIFGYSAYLFGIFFLVNGILSFLNLKKRSNLLNFIYFFLGIIFLHLCTSMLGMHSFLLESFIADLTYGFRSNYINNNIYFFLLVLFFGLVSLFLIFISLNFKIKYFISILRCFIISLNIFWIPIKKIKIPKIKNLSHNLIIKKNKSKIEPTIIARKRNNNIRHPSSKTVSSNQSTNYILPSVSLLKKSSEKKVSTKENEKINNIISQKLEITLAEYGVDGRVINYKTGPVVTLFEFIPAAGVKTSKIVALSDDITRAMSSLSTRIAAQPGKNSVGIEIPNIKRDGVLLGDLIDNPDFLKNENGLILALGKNIAGEKKYTNLEKMPHLLIAGTTGSGKSVGINSMIISLLYKFAPSECKLILIDPKMLELSIYEDIPHLLTPVVTNPNKAVFALKWVVREMENRYKLMSSLNVKNISSFNTKVLSALSTGRKLFREIQTGVDRETRKPIIEKKEIPLEKMPLIVVIIDEMADLMMVAGKEVENLVQRLAQMARASGIHIIAATQRPSVDVITGTIKANFPSRISFRVASRFDSRTILNEMGAEQLLGSGDMLFIENGASLNRVHGGYVSEGEIESVVNHIKNQTTNEIQEDIIIENTHSEEKGLELGFENKNVDELYEKAVEIVLHQQKVSTSFIQRYLQIGYNRAARIVEQMEEEGLISEASHAGKRNVLKKK